MTKEASLRKMEEEIAVGFEAEGNIYIVKSTAKANLVLKLKFANEMGTQTK